MSDAAVTRRARAKINLYLHVTGRRDDGYHRIDSLFAFADFGDELTFTPADDLTLALSGPCAAGLGKESDNLVLRAARALKQAAGVPQGARITLIKNLPLASGIGGGSADAAAALKGLNMLWAADLPQKALADIARDLGADVPACLSVQPVLVAGIGEEITPAPALPGCAVLLANPGVELPTPAVFKAYAESAAPFRDPDPLRTKPDDFAAFVAALRDRGNDLQAPAIALCPEIGAVLEALDNLSNCALSRMSGSGATCFGLFRTLEEAKAGAERLRARHEDWWIAAAPLLV